MGSLLWNSWNSLPNSYLDKTWHNASQWCESHFFGRFIGNIHTYFRHKDYYGGKVSAQTHLFSSQPYKLLGNLGDTSLSNLTYLQWYTSHSFTVLSAYIFYSTYYKNVTLTKWVVYYIVRKFSSLTLTIEEVKVMSEYEVWIISTITFLRMTSMKNDIDIMYDVLINERHKHNSFTNILIFNCR